MTPQDKIMFIILMIFICAIAGASLSAYWLRKDPKQKNIFVVKSDGTEVWFDDLNEAIDSCVKGESVTIKGEVLIKYQKAMEELELVLMVRPETYEYDTGDVFVEGPYSKDKGGE